jgi:hypothetical protein
MCEGSQWDTEFRIRVGLGSHKAEKSLGAAQRRLRPQGHPTGVGNVAAAVILPASIDVGHVVDDK